MSKSEMYINISSEKSVKASCPVIISASRSTDIPAFYSEWFINRLKKGYVRWKNPFNGLQYYVSFDKSRLIVFWSKNPKPIFKYLDYLDSKSINYYFQFTLNDYVTENLEKKIPALNKRIDTFIELSEKIGKEKIIWRFDPLILTNEINTDLLLKKIQGIGDKLHAYTDKLVFSFADISIYKKVQSNLIKEDIQYIEFDKKKMIEVASGIRELNRKWKFEVGTCSEDIDLQEFDIIHNKCIDHDLIIKLFSQDKALMNHLGYKIPEPNLFDDNLVIKTKKRLKDKGQRQLCGCIISKDIGQYNTCPHGCVYCYANTSMKIAIMNYNKHLEFNKMGATICGE